MTNLQQNTELEALVVEMARFLRNRHFGKYRGIVTDVEDPEKVGRILAKVPDVMLEEESVWAMPAAPFAGKSHGLMTLPEPGDGVWIEFEAGDISRPIWSGFWWARDEMPDEGKPNVRALVTTKGHKLVLDDENDKVQLLHSGGAEISMSATEIKLSIGATEIVLSSAGMVVNKGALEVK